MGDFLVAGGLIEGPDGLLLVRNRRRDGSYDWTPPGGVVEIHEGESVEDGLTREVLEETGLRVTSWEGPVYRIEAQASGLGWTLRVEVYRATSYEGELHVDDPDGIVVDAKFVAPDECPSYIEACGQWVREPLGAWLLERWVEARDYRYRLEGTSRRELTVVRL